jgi:hypothetical protein
LFSGKSFCIGGFVVESVSFIVVAGGLFLVILNQVNPKDYNDSRYDRGHMAPAADFNTRAELFEKTFSMANISPQVCSQWGGGTGRTLLFHDSFINCPSVELFLF